MAKKTACAEKNHKKISRGISFRKIYFGFPYHKFQQD